MLPRDTITKSIFFEKGDNEDKILDSTTDFKTILGIHFLQSSNASDTFLKCGQEDVYQNFGEFTGYIDLNFSCQNNLKIEKTGTDEAQIIVNYVVRDRGNIPDPFNDSFAAINTQVFLTNFFLFIIILGGIIFLVSMHFLGLKMKK